MRTNSRVSLCWFGMLLAVLGLTLVLAETTTTVVADQPVLRPVCACSTDGQDLPSAVGWSSSSGGRVLTVAHHTDQPSPRRVIRQRTGSTDRRLGDRDVDVRRELADTATSLRWHHGTPDGLPPGS